MSSWTVRSVLSQFVATPFSESSFRNRREISCSHMYREVTKMARERSKRKGSIPILPVHKLVNILPARLKKLKANSKLWKNSELKRL